MAHSIEDLVITCSGCGGVATATNIVMKNDVLISYDIHSTCWCKDEEMEEECATC